MREPDARDSLIVLALALLGIAPVMLLAGLGMLPGESAVIVLQLLFFGVPLGYAKLAGLKPWAACGFVALPARKIALVLIASLGSLWLLSGLTQVQGRVIRHLGYEEKVQAEEQHIRQTITQAQSQGAGAAIVLLAVIPPLCEETFFRGLLFRGLLRRFGAWIAILGTSLLFSQFHQTLVQSALMVVLGSYFAGLVYLTGSLWAGILAHSVNNLAVVTLTRIYGPEMQEMTAPAWMYAVSAGVFGLAIAALWADRKPATK